jgi:hypothetical protein
MSLSFIICFFSTFLCNLQIPIFSLTNPHLVTKTSNAKATIPGLSKAAAIFVISFLFNNNFLFHF